MLNPSIEDLARLASEASGMVRALYAKPEGMNIEMKSDDTPVTAADRAVQDLVKHYMTSRFPHVPVVGEEGQLGKRSGDPSEYWLSVDELDGTWAYMLGVPMFTSTFALMRGAVPVLSAIVDPMGDRLYLAERGGGTILNGMPISVCSSLPEMPTVGFVSWPTRGLATDMAIPGMVSKVLVGLHDMGCVPVSMVSCAYLDAKVAEGKLQAMVFPGQTLHDSAPGHLIVQEAGGTVTDLRGDPLRYDGTSVFGHLCSMGGDFHEELLRLTRSAAG